MSDRSYAQESLYVPLAKGASFHVNKLPSTVFIQTYRNLASIQLPEEYFQVFAVSNVILTAFCSLFKTISLGQVAKCTYFAKYVWRGNGGVHGMLLFMFGVHIVNILQKGLTSLYIYQKCMRLVNSFPHWCTKQIFLYYFILASFDKLKLKSFKFASLPVRPNVFLQVTWLLNFMYLPGITLRLPICKCLSANATDISCINVRDHYFFLDCFILLFMIFFNFIEI